MPRWRVIPTAAHGFLDFSSGIALIVIALLATDGDLLRSIFVIIGCGILLYSAFTDYEFGIIRILRVRLHLAIDFVLGIAVIILPSLLDMPTVPGATLYVLGIVSIVAALTTRLHTKQPRLRA